VSTVYPDFCQFLLENYESVSRDFLSASFDMLSKSCCNHTTMHQSAHICSGSWNYRITAPCISTVMTQNGSLVRIRKWWYESQRRTFLSSLRYCMISPVRKKQANKHIHFALNYTLIITLQHFYCFRHSAPSVRGILTFYFSLTSSADILGLQMWRILETTDHHSCNCSKRDNHFHSKSKFCELLAPCSAEIEITL